ncbi:hypothetical protein [Pseudomonas sp. NPDC089401]|uniref:hypothetical protein n=1 Tax=Pseudomonas sp. NPDC089401 TaxID=3364462 RepID=UPI00381D149F
MTQLKARIETFRSADGDSVFAQCCFTFETLTVGDFDQLMVAGSLNVAFLDLFNRIKAKEPIHLTTKQLEDELKALEEDLQNYDLPTGVESFDGEFVSLVIVDGNERLAVRPWGEKKAMLMDISQDNYMAFMYETRETLVEQCKKLGLALDNQINHHNKKPL